jgi:hypothetical protein
MKKSIIAGSLMVLTVIFSGLAGAMDSVGPKPFDAVELEKFITDYPGLTKWQSKDGQFNGNLSDAWVMAGMQFNKEFSASLKEKGWDSERFFYLLNHVRQGVRQERHKQRQQKAEARINKQMAGMAARMAAQRAEFDKQNLEQSQRAKAWVNDQLEAQKKRVRENPYMHPLQKKNIMDFLNRSSSEARFISTTPLSYEQSVARSASRQQAWEAEYRQSIQNNPRIPGQQKKMILDGMDQAKQSMAQTKPVDMPSQKEMMSRMQDQRKAWIVRQIEQVEKNSFYSDKQRAKIIKRLQRFAKLMQEGPETKASGILPTSEESLIGKNVGRLLEMLSKK